MPKQTIDTKQGTKCPPLVIELPVAWVERLGEYTKMFKNRAVEDIRKEDIYALLGYLDSLNLMIKK